MKTLVLGATPNPQRYAYKAIHALVRNGLEVVPVGIKSGEVAAINILNGKPSFAPGEIDTVTLYVGPKHQIEWIDYILNLKPRRVIFNPGTENPELFELLKANNIEPVLACTLVMLSTKQYA
jgi:predicted CoA-binding protein